MIKGVAVSFYGCSIFSKKFCVTLNELSHDAEEVGMLKRFPAFSDGFVKLGRHDGVRGRRSVMGDHTMNEHVRHHNRGCTDKSHQKNFLSDFYEI